MTYKEESYMLDSIGEIMNEVHENNLMLHQICDVVNTYLANHNSENEDDFGRNVLANLLSSGIDISNLFKRR